MSVKMVRTMVAASCFLAAVSWPRPAAALPAEWELLKNQDGKVVGAMQFEDGDPLKRHAARMASRAKPDVMVISFHRGEHDITAVIAVATELRETMRTENGAAPTRIYYASCNSAMEAQSLADGGVRAVRSQMWQRSSRAWSTPPPGFVIAPAPAQILADSLGLPVTGEIPRVEGELAKQRVRQMIAYRRGSQEEAFITEEQHKIFRPGSLTQARTAPTALRFNDFLEGHFDFAAQSPAVSEVRTDCDAACQAVAGDPHFTSITCDAAVKQ